MPLWVDTKFKMKKFWKKWKETVLIGAAILALALFLRLYNLNLLPIFGDEAIYVRWAQVMRAEPTLRFMPLSDGKQPLFMWSIIPFLKVLSDPLSAGRIVSVLTGLGSLVGVFVLSFYLFKSRKIALIASFFWAVSPFSVFFDRMALVDSMLAMFGVWTLIFGLITAKTLRLDTAMLTGFALGGALLTKSPALFFVILLPLTWFLSNWPKGRRLFNKKRLVHLTKLAALLVVSLVIAYAMYNILRLGPNFHMVGIRNQDYIFPLSHLWTNPKDPFIAYFDRSIEWLWQLGPSLLVIFILGSLVNLKKYGKEIILLATWGFLPILVQSEFAKVFTTRYILFSLPPLIVLAASTFTTGGERLKKILVAGLIFFTFHSFYIDRLILTQPEAAPLPRTMRSGYLEEWTSGTGISEVSMIIREEYRQSPQQKIVVGTEGYFGTLPDGLQAYLNDLPDITVIGVGLGIKQIPVPLIESKSAGNKTYLVINSSRLKADPQELGLKVIAAYPKAFRPEGLKEYVVHGPRDTLYLFEVTKEATVLLEVKD